MQREFTSLNVSGGSSADDRSLHGSDDEHGKPRRDWKRVTLIFGLGVLSWVATYVGMLELIESNLGSLPFSYRIITGLSVAMLMVMIIWLLDQMFKPQPLLTRSFYVVGYLFLTLISVGFGFGFYWKVLESRSEATRSAESAITQVQASLAGASTRLNQLETTLVQLSQLSSQKAELERTKGSSCPGSRPGDGPRRRMRDADAEKFSFASQFVGSRSTAVKSDIKALDGELAKVISGDKSTFDPKTGTRNVFLRDVGRKLEMTSARFNAFRSDPQLRQIRSDLAERSQTTRFPDGRGGTVSCPDAQLQAALGGVVKAIDQLPELEQPKISVVEGSEATIEAFRRLTTTLGGLLTFNMPPSADELRELQKKAIRAFEAGGGSAAQVKAFEKQQGGLSSRDYVPLGIAVFVDFCLFLVSLVQRPAGRLDGMVPKMKAAERGPVIQILSRFNEIHRDRNVRENFEIFRHVVFDMNGDYYAAIPLDAPTRLNPEQREALRVEAQLLGNLFASFEKDKIFKRTLLPTTSSVQKRLQRQGSKFAASEAFRVYKFADGAWSEIILGAVMGAARRMDRDTVRADQRSNVTATSGRGLPLTNEAGDKSLDSGAASYDQDEVARRGLSDIPEAAVMTATRGGLLDVSDKLPTMSDQVMPDPDHISRFGPYANVYRPEMPARLRAPQEPRVRRAQPPPLPEAEVKVASKERNTASGHADPVAASSESGGLIMAMPSHPLASETDFDGGDVTLTPKGEAGTTEVTLKRETATFTIPVSQATLPRRLSDALAAMRDQDESGENLLTNYEASGSESEKVVSDEQDVVTSEDEMAFFKRMAPPAAE